MLSVVLSLLVILGVVLTDKHRDNAGFYRFISAL